MEFVIMHLMVNAVKMVNRVGNENGREGLGLGLVIDGLSVGGCFCVCWDFESLKGYVGRRGYVGRVRGQHKETADDRHGSILLRY